MTTRLNHVALVRRSESESDRFFQGVLGLEKTRSKTVSAELCCRLFDLGRDYRLVYYGDDQLQFEVFLSESRDFAGPHVGHVCLEVDDADALLAKCAAAGLKVRKAPRGDSFVVFVEDEDGNLFEIKQRS
jgi:catechol 2,3-dioxygenase-like lactoylglutathione lyase family enzyme